MVLTISPSWEPIKYLEPLLLNLSDTAIWSMFTNTKSIGSLDMWNCFLLTLILLNFSVFFSHVLYYAKNKKVIYFLALPCYIGQILGTFFFGTH